MSFPASPVLNEVFIADGKAWRWDGANWVIPKKPLPEWDEIRNKPTYYKADWNDTDNKPDYFLGKVVVSDLPPTNAVEGTVWFDATNERQYTYQQGLWIDPTTATRSRYISVDPDVVNYIEAVEAADGEPLEQDVVTALEAFILGCKADQIWDAIKSSCIFAGAKTFNGAITSLAGPSITVSGSPGSAPSFASTYNRKTGVNSYGNINAQKIDTNFNNNLTAPTSKHCAVYLTEPDTITSSTNNKANIIGWDHWYSRGVIIATDFSTGNYYASVHGNGVDTGVSYTTGLGFVGVTRGDATFFNFRNSNSTQQFFVNSSNAVGSGDVFIKSNTTFGTGSINGSNCRMSFYSIGENIDLAKLDNRVTKLMTKLNTILP